MLLFSNNTMVHLANVFLLVVVASYSSVTVVEAAFFAVGRCGSPVVAHPFLVVHTSGSPATTTTTTQVFSTPPQPPRQQPRRMLKKKRGRAARRRGGNGSEYISSNGNDSFPWDTAESRPLVSSVSKEAGEDYWMDAQELEQEQQRQQAIKNRKAMEGEVSKEKLWSEVKAPYKQNWIGIVTVIILILSVIGSQFPELLENPVIPIPDL